MPTGIGAGISGVFDLTLTGGYTQPYFWDTQPARWDMLADLWNTSE